MKTQSLYAFVASLFLIAPELACAQPIANPFDLPKTTPEHFTLSSPAPQPSALLIKPPVPAFQETPTPTLAPIASPQAMPGATAAPEASATPEAAPAAAPPVDINSLLKHSNPNFNPCGGWRQMLVSYAGATNCVLDAGEVIIGANYAGTYIPLGTQLNVNGTTATTTTTANVHAFPGTPLGVGLGGRWQFSYTPPEYQEIIGANHNIDQSGATNQVFSFRNMFFFNRCFTYCGGDSLSAVMLTYSPPSGSPAWRGIGPSYSIAFSTTVAVQKSPSGKGRILINLYDPLTYAVISSTPGHVQWGWASTLLTTMIWIHHSWRLNTSIGYTIPGHQWVWNINPNYLISRRLVVGMNFGGTGEILNTQSGISPNYIAATNTTFPRFIDFSIYYLIGHTIPPIKGLPATDAPGD